MNLHKDAPGEQWRKKGTSGILAKGRVKSPSLGPLEITGGPGAVRISGGTALQVLLQ